MAANKRRSRVVRTVAIGTIVLFFVGTLWNFPKRSNITPQSLEVVDNGRSKDWLSRPSFAEADTKTAIHPPSLEVDGDEKPNDWVSKLSTTQTHLEHTDPERTDLEAAIPNIVHYAWVLKNPQGELKFQFKHFISIYSACMYLKTETIYIHTNAPSETVSRARSGGDYWTKSILQLPQVKMHQMVTPTHTNKGMKLEALEHVSDFMRPGILHDYGGIYLDFDVIPIRDMKALRESGFNNIFGHELNEKVNNGIMLSKKGSRFMQIYDREQHEAFDGEWITHSVDLLTTMANALAAAENEVLILERKAFNPDGWSPDAHAALFRSHGSQAVHNSGPPDKHTHVQHEEDMDVDLFWNLTKTRKREDWEMSYNAAYLIHASSPHIEPPTPDCGDIKWEYVMLRKSNYAIQVYPAIWHAIKTGVISGDVRDHV